MAEEASREHDERQRAPRSEPSAQHYETGYGAPTRDGAPAYGVSLLGNPVLKGSRNGSARSAAMLRAQQHYGNRAVQRFLNGRNNRPATSNSPSSRGRLAVQRCGPTPCGCSAEEKIKHSPSPAESMLMLGGVGMPLQRSAAYDRAPAVEVQRVRYDQFTPGDAYAGPSGIDAPDPKKSVGALGGLVSYGCYCGPGGDSVTGSRCGDNAPAVDAIDQQCKDHDHNYHEAHVDSGFSDDTVNMFSPAGWLKSSDADHQLYSTVDAETKAHPENYSPSALLYAQGIKGIFGGRAGVSDAYNWGAGKENEAEAGISGAYDSAASWGSSALGQASAGVGNFLDSASKWNSVDDAVSGIGGGVMDATSWGLGKAGEAASGVAGAVSDAGSWAANTGLDMLTGLGNAGAGVAKWEADTAGAVENLALDKAGGAVDWAEKKASGVWGDITSLF